jgi:hypothetical protein
MMDRCYLGSSDSFPEYGGRQISVCSDWDDYTNFKAWALTHGYKDGLSIERIDVNENYCPENCEWIPLSKQNRNKQNTLYLTAWGETKCMKDWAEDERCVVGYKCLWKRIKGGHPPEQAMSQPNQTAGRPNRLSPTPPTAGWADWARSELKKQRRTEGTDQL